MDNRFYRPRYSQSTMPCRYNSGIPIHSSQPNAQNHKPEAMAIRKVVQIPVRFIDSEPSRRLDSALKIQKVFRGFLIRRNVKKIMQLNREADEIAQKISRSDTVELILKDQKERLKINEMLMAMLFKLDLIRGLDAGVRDCRKAVVKKVISLQDRVDAIVSSGGDLEMKGLEEENSVKDNESGEICEGDCEIEESEVKSKEDNFEDGIDYEEESNVGKEKEEEIRETMEEESNVGKKETEEIMETLEEKSGGEKKESGTENNEQELVLQKLMEDNQKMMKMMTQLFERNEMQTQTLNTLRNKVELLEKAFVCSERTRKKKKIKRHSS